MLDNPSTPLFCWLKWTKLCAKSNSCPFLITHLPQSQYIKKNVGNLPFSSWNRMRPFFVVTLYCLLILWCDHCNWVGSTYGRRGGKYSSLYSQCIFPISLQKLKDCFSESFAWRMSLTCKNTAAIWSVSRFLNNSILKTSCCSFLQST